MKRGIQLMMTDNLNVGRFTYKADQYTDSNTVKSEKIVAFIQYTRYYLQKSF